MTGHKCGEFANFFEGDATTQIQITATCDNVIVHEELLSENTVHHDPVYGYWDKVRGLHDRSKHPGWRE